MEVAIYMEIGQKLKDTTLEALLTEESNTYQQQKMSYLRKAISSLQERGINHFMRVYFGSEFCDKCIPTTVEIDDVLIQCEQFGLQFTFVTPPLSNEGMQVCLNRIEYIESRLEDFEIVVNDLGLAYYLRKKHDHRLISGRLFDKLSHDGRVSREVLLNYYGQEGLRYAGESAIFSCNTKSVLKRLNIDQVEMDLPIQPVIIPNQEVNLYMPFSYLATGKRCMFESLSDCNVSTKGYFCSRECLKYNQLMKKMNNVLKKEKLVYQFRKGNTIFFGNSYFNEVLEQVNRVILEVQI